MLKQVLIIILSHRAISASVTMSESAGYNLGRAGLVTGMCNWQPDWVVAVYGNLSAMNIKSVSIFRNGSIFKNVTLN